MLIDHAVRACLHPRSAPFSSTSGSRSLLGTSIGCATGSFSIMTNREWLGRRLPLWALVLFGVVLLATAALLLFVVDSKLVVLAMSPLAVVGLFTLAYALGEWRRRSDEPSDR